MPKKRTSLTGALLGRVNIKEISGKYIAAETAAGLSELSAMGKRMRRRLMLKAERLLYSEGVGAIVMCSEAEQAFGKYTKESRRIPKQKLFDGFEFAMNKCRQRVENVVISDRDMSCVTTEALIKLCRRVHYITLCTEENKTACEIAENIFAEYGACVFVEKEFNRKAFAVIDTDGAYIRIGDFVIDGAEFENDIADYRINTAELAAQLGENNSLEIKNWISGKNIIKIS